MPCLRFPPRHVRVPVVCWLLVSGLPRSALARNRWGALPNSFLPPAAGTTAAGTGASSPSSKSQEFLQECESFLSLLQSLRGGASSGREYTDDDEYYYPSGDDRFPYQENYYKNNNKQQDDYYYSSQPGDGRSSQQRRWQQQDDRDDDDYYYDDNDDNDYYNRPSRSTTPAFLSSMPSVIQNGDRRIGASLLGGGSVITLLGISLFFNKSLMRLGNLLFIAGVPMLIGPSRTVGYFLQPAKTRATACLALGIFLVFVGMPIFGIVLEAFGILNLFGNMFPVILAIAKTLPGVGPVLNSFTSGNNGNSRRRRYEEEEEEEYYEDRWDAQDDYGRRDDRGRYSNEQNNGYY